MHASSHKHRAAIFPGVEVLRGLGSNWVNDASIADNLQERLRDYG
jgi:hypothetical protein